MSPEEFQKVTYDLEVQKFNHEKERQIKEQEREDQKLDLEKKKARWAAISAWSTPLSILGSVIIAVVTIINSQKTQEKTAKADFMLKATEIVLQNDDPEVNWNKACRIAQLFPDRIPLEWVKGFNWENYAAENDDLKREVAKLLIEQPTHASQIIATYGKLFQSDKTVVDPLNRLGLGSVTYSPAPARDCKGPVQPSSGAH